MVIRRAAAAAALALALVQAALTPASADPAALAEAGPNNPGANSSERLSNQQLLPRVALVLGGGGARGGAHIGVLQALEEARVPIHLVVGTSIGAVVGGLYASGMSPDELATLAHTIDWDDVFVDEPDRQTRPFRRKQDDRNFLVKAAPGIGIDGLRLPQGLIQGQKFRLILRRESRRSAGVQDFDQLPVPFRAVAADLTTGKAVVLDGGDLATAMAASMAIPGLISPIRHQDHLLVDGGIADNLPISLARQLGADVVIAVDLSTPLRGEDRLRSLLDVTDQLTNLMVRRNVQQQLTQLRDHDILISPDLTGMASTNFRLMAEGIAAGYHAGQALAKRLAPLALAPAAWQQRAQRLRLPIDHQLAYRGLRFDDTSFDPEYLRARLDLPNAGTVSTRDLERGLNHLYALETFDNVGWYLDQDDTLVISAPRRPWGPNYLRFGITLSDDLSGNSDFTLGTSFTVTELTSHGGEWRNELHVGARPLLYTELYLPLDQRGRWFIAPNLGAGSIRRQLFQPGSDQPLAEFRFRGLRAGFAAGRELGRWGETRIGISSGRGWADTVIGGFELPQDRGDTGQLSASFNWDNLDSLFFPRDGGRANLGWRRSLTGLGADRSWQGLSLDATLARSLGAHTLTTSLDLATITEGQAPLNEQFTLGGFLNLSGYQRDQLLGQHRALGRLLYYYRMGERSWLPSYLGFSLEAGNVWQDRNDISFSDLRLAGSLVLGADTPLGPLYLGAGLAEDGRTSLHLFLGRSF